MQLKCLVYVAVFVGHVAKLVNVAVAILVVYVPVLIDVVAFHVVFVAVLVIYGAGLLVCVAVFVV